MPMPPLTHDEARIIVCCDRCGGAGVVQHPIMQSRVTACMSCLSAGWVWSDGRPPTVCPGGGHAPLHPPDSLLPCGRGGRTCPGCDRIASLIGGVEDVEASLTISQKHQADRLAARDAGDGKINGHGA